MKETIIQILEQHQKIVNHFLKLQREMEQIETILATLGLQIADLRRTLIEKGKNNNLHSNDTVN